jgi:hypothetical protein
MIEVLKQSAEDVSKVYDILAFGHTERALEILAKTRTSLRQAIAELKSQEPVAWRAPNWGHSADEYVYRDFDDPVIGVNGKPSPNNEPLYTHPSQRKPLTDEEIKTICSENGWDSSWQSLRFAQAIEAKLKEKNT